MFLVVKGYAPVAVVGVHVKCPPIPLSTVKVFSFPLPVSMRGLSGSNRQFRREFKGDQTRKLSRSAAPMRNSGNAHASMADNARVVTRGARVLLFRLDGVSARIAIVYPLLAAVVWPNWGMVLSQSTPGPGNGDHEMTKAQHVLRIDRS